MANTELNHQAATDTSKCAKKHFRSFAEAREFARASGVRSYREWQAFSKSGKRPADIPSNPNTTYAQSGWTNWNDFLGTCNRSGATKKHFRSFTEAREFARASGVQSYREWQAFSKSGKRPADIPSSPERVYAKSGWQGWVSFLGTGNVHGSGKAGPKARKQFRSYAEACEFARASGVQSRHDWQQFCKEGKRPANVPAAPYKIYADCGWTSWGDFLGTGTASATEKAA